MKFFVIFCLFTGYLFFTNSIYASEIKALPSTCLPDINSCNDYQCKESARQCGKTGYLLSFGHHYCQKYIDLNSEYKIKTQAWLSQVRLCLQNRTEAINLKSHSCKSIEAQAFDHHPKCYLDSGACDISIYEFFKVIKVLKLDALRPQVFQQGLEVLYQCAVVNGETDIYNILTKELDTL